MELDASIQFTMKNTLNMAIADVASNTDQTEVSVWIAQRKAQTEDANCATHGLPANCRPADKLIPTLDLFDGELVWNSSHVFTSL